MKPTAEERRGREAVRAIARRLESVAANDAEFARGDAFGATPLWLLEDLRALFRYDDALSYRPRPDDLVAERRIVGPHIAAIERFHEHLRSFPVPFHYDPLRPERSQRNHARMLDEVCTCRSHSADRPCARHALFHRVGLGEHDQLRVLVCEGDALLAWVGGIRAEPFTEAERRVLEALTKPLARNLALRRRLLDHQLVGRGLEAALEAIGVPAYLARRDGTVIHASTSARTLYDDGQLHRDTVRAHVHGRSTVTPLVVGDELGGYLVLLEGDRIAVARCAALWSATDREREVLAQLVTGESNKEIALRLRVSEVTVERHVTSLLRKARCDSRARLIATFWRLSR